MKLSLKTQVLWLLAIVLGVAAFWPKSSVDPRAGLPTIAEVNRAEVSRVEITKGQVQKVVMTGSELGGFQVTQPYTGPADWMMLRSLLNQFQDAVLIDVRVDEGDNKAQETYGVDDQNGVLVEIFTTGETPAISFVVGYDLPGGSSFIRLKDSDVIYRARVGGRARYEKDPSDWQDRGITTWEEEQVLGVQLDRGGVVSTFIRAPGENGRHGEWRLLEDSAYPLDQKAISALARALGTLRASRVLSADFDGGFSPPASTVKITDAEGNTRTLVFGTASADGAAYVKVDGRDTVYQVSEAHLRAVTRPLMELKDRTILSFDRNKVATLTLDDVTGRVVLAQLPDGMWEVREPANVDADVKQVLFTVNTLADLRADAVATVDAREAGLSEPGQTFTVTLIDGESVVLEVGKGLSDDQGRPMRYVRKRGSDSIFIIKESELGYVRKGFGRAD